MFKCQFNSKAIHWGLSHLPNPCLPDSCQENPALKIPHTPIQEKEIELSDIGHKDDEEEL